MIYKTTVTLHFKISVTAVAFLFQKAKYLFLSEADKDWAKRGKDPCSTRMSKIIINSLLTEPSAPTARPPADGSLRSPSPLPFDQKIWSDIKNLTKKKIGKKFEKKFKKQKEIVKFFSVEIFHMMSRLRMQNFTIIGQGVSEISVRTNNLGLLFYNRVWVFPHFTRSYSFPFPK